MVTIKPQNTKPLSLKGLIDTVSLEDARVNAPIMRIFSIEGIAGLETNLN